MENKLNQLTFEFLTIPLIAIPSIVLMISAIILIVFSGFDSVTIHWANYSDYQWINIANIIISALLILAAMTVEKNSRSLVKKMRR